MNIDMSTEPIISKQEEESKKNKTKTFQKPTTFFYKSTRMVTTLACYGIAEPKERRMKSKRIFTHIIFSQNQHP